MLTFISGEQKKNESASSWSWRKAMWLGSKPDAMATVGCLS